MSGLEGGESTSVIKRVAGAVGTAGDGILERVRRLRPDRNWGIFFQNYLRNNGGDLSDLKQLASTLQEENFRNHSPTGILTAFAFAAKGALGMSNGGQKDIVAARVRAATIAVLGIYSEAAADKTTDKAVNESDKTSRAATCAIGTVKGMGVMNELGLLEDPAVKAKAAQTLQGFIATSAFQSDLRPKTIIEPARKLLGIISPSSSTRI